MMWILPSRGRPESLKRFFKAWEETGASTCGVVCVDELDPLLDQYVRIKIPENWEMEIEDRQGKGLASVCNRQYENNPWEPFYGLLADDLVPITKHWDTELIDAALNSGLSYSNDNLNGMLHAAHPCLSGDFVRSLGWICMPGLDHLYIDNVLFEIAKKQGKLHYLGDVMVEHWHFTTGKSPYDETYKKPTATHDKEVYDKWRHSFA